MGNKGGGGKDAPGRGRGTSRWAAACTSFTSRGVRCRRTSRGAGPCSPEATAASISALSLSANTTTGPLKVPCWCSLLATAICRAGQRHLRAGHGRRAGLGRTGQGRAGQGRAGQGRAGQGRVGHGRRAGQGRVGHGRRAGQGRAGQGRNSGQAGAQLSMCCVTPFLTA